MRLIVCIDNRDGVMFNRRRVSSDAAVTDRIVEKLEGRLYVNAYSAELFAEKTERIVVCDDFLERAGEADTCFVENTDILPYLVQCKQIFLYRWNRKYPSDVKFPTVQALQGRRLISSKEFKGISHECITEEVWE